MSPEALLTEYHKAPRVMTDRLYIEAIKEVYANSSKVFVDSQGSGNLLYLPIDKLIGGSDRAKTRTTPNRPDDSPATGDVRDSSSDSTTSRDRKTRQ